MLQEFEDRDVVRSTVKLVGAGDGLSEPMKIEPVEFHHGDRLFVLCEATIVGVGYEPTNKDDPAGAQMRVHKAKAGSMTIVPAEIAAPLIEAQRDAILKAREEEAGIQRLALDGEDDPEAGDPEVGE